MAGERAAGTEDARTCRTGTERISEDDQGLCCAL